MNLYTTIIGLVLIGCSIAILLLCHCLGIHYFASSSCRQITTGYREAASKLEDEIGAFKGEIDALNRMVKPIWKTYESPRRIFFVIQTTESGGMEYQRVTHWIRNYPLKFTSNSGNGDGIYETIDYHPDWWKIEERESQSTFDSDPVHHKMQEMILNINIDKVYKISSSDTSPDDGGGTSNDTPTDGGDDNHTSNVGEIFNNRAFKPFTRSSLYDREEFLVRLDISHHACIRDELSSKSWWSMSIVSAQSLFEKEGMNSMRFNIDERRIILNLNEISRHKRYVRVQQDKQIGGIKGRWSLLVLLEEFRKLD